MDKDEAIRRMSEALVTSHGDPEAGHSEADRVLCDFLEHLGHADLVDLWKRVEKWYA